MRRPSNSPAESRLTTASSRNEPVMARTEEDCGCPGRTAIGEADENHGAIARGTCETRVGRQQINRQVDRAGNMAERPCELVKASDVDDGGRITAGKCLSERRGLGPSWHRRR